MHILADCVIANILQSPPLTDPEYLHNDIFFNPFVIQLMNMWVSSSLSCQIKLTSLSYLGANPIWNFVTGNNALPRTSGLRQPVHKDVVFKHPTCPFYVIANIPLCPFNKNTGATEFWLGSHAHTTGADQIPVDDKSELANATLVIGEPSADIKLDVLEARREKRAPIQPVCEKGDICLRDLKTWHAGMPNESENYRIMLALGYQVCRNNSLKRGTNHLVLNEGTGSMVSKSYVTIEVTSKSRQLFHEARRSSSPSSSGSSTRW